MGGEKGMGTRLDQTTDTSTTSAMATSGSDICNAIANYLLIINFKLLTLMCIGYA